MPCCAYARQFEDSLARGVSRDLLYRDFAAMDRQVHEVVASLNKFGPYLQRDGGASTRPTSSFITGFRRGNTGPIAAGRYWPGRPMPSRTRQPSCALRPRRP